MEIATEKSKDDASRDIARILREKNNILLVTHAKMDCDALSSTVALYLILRKMGKKVTAVCQDPVPEAFRFLPDTDVMNTAFAGNSNFIITIDTSQKGIEDITWNIEDNKVNIIITPKAGEGMVSENDLTFSGGTSKNFDLIISCDAADIEQLGKIYEDNTSLFHSLPLVVIDHHASNDGFGTINHIVVTNASTTEVIFDLIPEITGKGHEYLDADIATLLLAGIITDTGSFQHPNTTPKSFEVAANLIDMGARQQEIIKHLFKTKKLTTLRLWGRVLSKIKNDPIHRFVWSTVSEQDFSDEQASSDETEGLIDELLSNAPGVEVVLLLKEREDGVISGSIRTTTPACDATKIAEMFGGGGHRQAAGFKIRNAVSFEGVIADVIPKIQEYQAERLGIQRKNPHEETQNKESSPQKSERDPDEMKKSSVKESKTEKPGIKISDVKSSGMRAVEDIRDFDQHPEKESGHSPVLVEREQRSVEDIHDFDAVIPGEKKIPKILPDDAIPDWMVDGETPKNSVREEKEEIPEWLYDTRKNIAPEIEMPGEKERKVSPEDEIPDWLEEKKPEKKSPNILRKESIPLQNPEMISPAISPVKKSEKEKSTSFAKERAVTGDSEGKGRGNIPPQPMQKKSTPGGKSVQKSAPQKSPVTNAPAKTMITTQPIQERPKIVPEMPKAPHAYSVPQQSPVFNPPVAPTHLPPPSQPKAASPASSRGASSLPPTPPKPPQPPIPRISNAVPEIKRPVSPIPPLMPARIPEQQMNPRVPQSGIPGQGGQGGRPSERKNELPPLANILDPNPPADLIPQAPKTAPRPAMQAPQQIPQNWTPPPPQYGPPPQGTYSPQLPSPSQYNPQMPQPWGYPSPQNLPQQQQPYPGQMPSPPPGYGAPGMPPMMNPQQGGQQPPYPPQGYYPPQTGYPGMLPGGPPQQ